MPLGPKLLQASSSHGRCRSARAQAKVWTHSKASVPITPTNIPLTKAAAWRSPESNGARKTQPIFSSETFTELQNSMAESVHEQFLKIGSELETITQYSIFGKVAIPIFLEE